MVNFFIFLFADERVMSTRGDELRAQEKAEEEINAYMVAVNSPRSSLYMPISNLYGLERDKEENDTFHNLNTNFADNKETNQRPSQTNHTMSVGRLVWELFHKKMFLYSMLSIASVYFLVTGIQFWISDYFRVVLKVPKERVFISFFFISVTAPILGVIIGGKISDRLGGYTGENAVLFCLVHGALSSAVALPIPFLDNFYLVAGFLWLLFYFGGGLMPTLTGLMISSIPKPARNMGSSIAQFFMNLLGYLPAPTMYGLVQDISGGKESRWGLVMLMCWSLWGVVFLLLGYYHQQKKINENRLRSYSYGQEPIAGGFASARRAKGASLQHGEAFIETNDELISPNLYTNNLFISYNDIVWNPLIREGDLQAFFGRNGLNSTATRNIRDEIQY